ncbi:MAG: 3-oxoacyl-ACP reductase, partial [Rhodobacteraceae bacterium]|nr:3-oxoacyl-ACP reductase [Paracoccaceae bacterium]
MKLSRDIAGQNFIVTGVARGIGLAISTLFSSLGARVSGWDLDFSYMQENSVFADTQVVD